MEDKPAQKYPDSHALAEKVIQIQRESPMMCEAHICVELNVGARYLYERAKVDPIISSARDAAFAIRQEAWVQTGVDAIWTNDDSRKTFNAQHYQWMTRNLIKFKDRDPVTIEKEDDKGESDKLIINI